MVKVNSGPVDAADKFNDTPKDKWRLLLIAKRSFLSTRLDYDCRCLIEFCEEAEAVYQDLGFASAEEMVREGYELEPAQVSLAVAWLKANEAEQAISLNAVVAEAKARPLADTKAAPNPGGVNQHTKEKRLVDNINQPKGGTGTEYTLRRLARDCPEMLDKIESGEMSVNQAAIAAGIRKKPSHAEVCVRAFRKAENRLEAIKLIVSELQPHEREVVATWIKGV